MTGKENAEASQPNREAVAVDEAVWEVEGLVATGILVIQLAERTYLLASAIRVLMLPEVPDEHLLRECQLHLVQLHQRKNITVRS